MCGQSRTERTHVTRLRLTVRELTRTPALSDYARDQRGSGSLLALATPADASLHECVDLTVEDGGRIAGLVLGP